MARRHYRLSDKELEFIAQDIGADLIHFFSPEERLQGLSLQERLNGLNRRELLRHLLMETQQRPLTAEERRILQQLLTSSEENSESTTNYKV